MATHAVSVRHALIVEHLPHLVRLVAIHTCRKNADLFFPQLPANDLSVDCFDLSVALAARCRDVLASYG